MNKIIYFISFFSLTLILTFLQGCSCSSTSDSVAALKTFVDPESTLEWASFQDADNTQYSYDEVMSYCDGLDAESKSDWRMPSADETLDFVIRNTDIYVSSDGYSSFVTTQARDFLNILNLQPNATYGSGGPNNIVFTEVPFIDYYSNDFRYYGEALIFNDNPADPNDLPAADAIYTPDEASALNVFRDLSLYDASSKDIWAFTCVRGIHSATSMPTGTWLNVENQVEIIGVGQYAHDLSIIDNKHIRLSTVTFQESYTINDIALPRGFIVDQYAHYISSGIPDARVKGQITSFAEATGTAPLASASAIRAKGSITGVAGIDVILGCLRNNEPQYCQEFIITPATSENPHNTYTLSTDDSGSNVLYVYQDSLGNYILDDANPITIATGEVTISLTDSAGNTAVFIVEITGNDTDVGVLNIPDITTLYNFKTTIDHGMDYIYHGYNDGESPVAYSKTLSICNIGSANISGTTFTIEVAPENTSLIRAFSHNYDGSSVGFTSGSCENYSVSFEFYKPIEDTEVKFNITIADNFNVLTWKDYTTFRLSQHSPVNVYFASNTQPMEGFLIAPGNQLVRVKFNQYQDSFMRVPSYPGSEYSVVLFTSSVAGEDTYMITTVDPPIRSRMDGFSDVYAYEPNDDVYNATDISFLNGEIISYLHSGDLDFYTIK